MGQKGVNFPGNTTVRYRRTRRVHPLSSRPREDIFTASIRILSRTGRERIDAFKAYEHEPSIARYHLYIKDIALHTSDHADH